MQRFAVAATLALSITLAAVPALLAQSTPAEIAPDHLNFYRQAAGMGLLTTQAQLTQAAVNHANYYLQNQAYTAHDATPGNPGFTGAIAAPRQPWCSFPATAWRTCTRASARWGP